MMLLRLLPLPLLLRATSDYRAAAEEQILELQQEKLATFDAELRERSEARSAHWDERIEHQRQIKLTEKDKEISQIQRRRIKALRKLSEARKHVEANKEPRDVVADASGKLHDDLAVAAERGPGRLAVARVVRTPGEHRAGWGKAPLVAPVHDARPVPLEGTARGE